MRPTVLVIAVLLLHGVNGHLFQRALPRELTKHMQLHKDHKRQSDVDKCIDEKIEEAFGGNSTLAISCGVAGEDAETDLDDDDDDFTQEEFNAAFSIICRPECGNVFIKATDECGGFDGEDVYLKDFIIGLCGTNRNEDKCYEIFLDAIDFLDSEDDCYDQYVVDNQCNCKSTLEAGGREQGCCLDIYYDILRKEDIYDASKLYDACDVDLPTGCNNSPIGGGIMPRVALVTMISALIFSIVFN